MSAGINKTNIDGSELRTSVDLEYEIGTSKLDVINSLCRPSITHQSILIGWETL